MEGEPKNTLHLQENRISYMLFAPLFTFAIPDINT